MDCYSLLTILFHDAAAILSLNILMNIFLDTFQKILRKRFFFFRKQNEKFCFAITHLLHQRERLTDLL